MKRINTAGWIMHCVGLLALVGAAPALAADESALPATGPSTQASAAVTEILERVNTAYAAVQSAQMDGHILGRFDIAGERKNEDVAFTSAFHGPNRFRHEAKGDVLLGSTGEKVYAYQPSRNIYLSVDAPKERVPLSEWPHTVAGILREQNPSMLLLLTKSASTELKELAGDMNRLADTTLDGVSYPTIQFELPSHEGVTLLVDSKTSFLRQVRFDLRKELEKRGAIDVKTAEVTVDYTHISTDPMAADGAFAWAPPAGAMLASTSAPAAGDDIGAAAAAIVGKPAPDFTLPGLDDKPVKLSSLKGSVVLLDFWATWCMPCVISLPKIDQLYKQQSPKGLKVFAVNQQEEKGVVKPFIAEKKWSFPVLLDEKGEVGGKYGADAIPETVIIGKDGVVKRVFVGGTDEIEEQIKSAVVKEMGS